MNIDKIKDDKDNITNFIKQKFELKDDEFNIELEKLMGFSNSNYIVIIKRKLSGNLLGKYVYRKFGIVSQKYDKNLEFSIIKYLFKKGIGPNIYIEDKAYSICQYLEDTKNLDLNHLFDEYIINSIIKILIIYNSICHIYKYNFINNKIIFKQIENNEEKKLFCESIHYNNVMDIFYKRALDNFNIFKKKFNKNISNNMEYENNFKKIDNFFNNFENLYKMIIPKEGIMVLNHNDCFSLNIMIRERDKNIFIIDNEYAALNFLGYDISYYICESHFSYENLFSFSIPEIDIDKCFNVYFMKYINEFKKANKNILNENDKLFDEIKTKKYYINLSLIANLFLYIYVLCYLDYDKWVKNKDKDFYFSSGVYRVNLYNYFKNHLDSITKK